MNTEKPYRKKIIKRLVGWSLTGFLVLLVIALAVTPGIIKNYVNKNGEDLTGRTVLIDKLKYNYFTSTVKIIGFKWFEKNDSDVFVSFDTLLVDMRPSKLLNDEVYVQQLLLVNPKGRIIQNDSVFNFDDLIKFYIAEDTAATAAAEAENEISYKLDLNNIAMKNGSFSYSDVVLNHTINFNKLYFDIPKIYWGDEEQSKVDVSFDLADGGHFTSGLNYNVDEGTYNGYMKIENLYLKTFLPYVQQYMNFSNVDGQLNSDINFSGSTDDYNDFEVSGTFMVDSLKLYDPDNKYVLGGKQSTVVLKTSKPLQFQIDVDLVQLDEPYVYFALIDSLSNFEKMLVYTSEEETEPEQSEVAGSSENFTINRLVVNNGLIDFSDQRFREEFFYELSEVTMDMDTLELQDDWVNVNANMKLNKRGNLEAQMGVDPYNPLDSIQINYVLTDFQLPDINVYSKHYMGLPILFGDMYYVSKTSIANKQLISDNELIIRNVEMGRKSGGLYDIPVKLALFILKDINGDINLDIPVRGDLSDPKTKIGPIVWNTFKSLMFKIVASPFKALGNLLGVDPKEIEEITFNYEDSTLVAKQTRSLDLLLQLEEKKPELIIELQYYNDRKLERTDAAEELSKFYYFKEKGKKARSNDAEYLKFLQEKTGKDSLLIQDYEILFAPKEMVDSVILDREKRRLSQTRNYLIQKNDSTAIKVLDYNGEDVLNIGSRPRFAVKYVLAEDAE